MLFLCSRSFVLSNSVRHMVRSEIGITFQIHTKDCRVHWSGELGLLRCDYGEIGNLCMLSDRVR